MEQKLPEMPSRPVCLSMSSMQLLCTELVHTLHWSSGSSNAALQDLMLHLGTCGASAAATAAAVSVMLVFISTSVLGYAAH